MGFRVPAPACRPGSAVPANADACVSDLANSRPFCCSCFMGKPHPLWSRFRMITSLKPNIKSGLPGAFGVETAASSNENVMAKVPQPGNSDAWLRDFRSRLGGARWMPQLLTACTPRNGGTSALPPLPPLLPRHRPNSSLLRWRPSPCSRIRAGTWAGRSGRRQGSRSCP